MCVPLAVRKNALKSQRMVLTACGSLMQQEFWDLSELPQVKAGLECEAVICITHCPPPRQTQHDLMGSRVGVGGGVSLF